MSSILGVGAGVGLVIGALIVEHLSWHWLFWIPLADRGRGRCAPGASSPSRRCASPGRVNWLAAALMSVGISLRADRDRADDRLGLGQRRRRWRCSRSGSRSARLWIVVEMRSREPLIDMTMMRIRGVWTTNLAAFLLGAGHVLVVHRLPASSPSCPRAPASASAPRSSSPSLYLLPCGARHGAARAARGPRRAALRLQARAGRRHRDHRGRVRLARGRPRHPYDMLISAALLGVGIGLAFAALGNLIVQAVPREADRRRERHEHRHADARRRARRPDRRDVHRRQHGSWSCRP